MAGFHLPFKFKSWRNRASCRSEQSIRSHSSIPIQSQPTVLREEEQQQEREVEFIPTRPLRRPPTIPVRRSFPKAIAAMLLAVIPLAIVGTANIPHALVRRPVAKRAPLLLLPSYFQIERNYRQAIAAVDEAEQLLQQASDPTELERVNQQIETAKEGFGKVPLGFLGEFPQYQALGYNWQFSAVEFEGYLATLKRLENSLVQERQARKLLFDLEQMQKTAKWDYLQAWTQTDKKAAIATWQAALDRLAQMPLHTLAGRSGQAKLATYEQEFQTTVGVTNGNSEKRANLIIEGARQFAWQAALASQNPPHSAAQWQQVEVLWQQAIQALERVSPSDSQHYTRAQQLLAKYSANLGQIQVRRQVEQDSAAALERAQRQLERFFAARPGEEALSTAQLQGIIRDLEKVKAGTTTSAKAQELLQIVNLELKALSPDSDSALGSRELGN